MAKESENKKVALLVFACDRYQFLFTGFAFFFNKYWDFSCNCSYYFATEKEAYAIGGFKPVMSGNGEWTERLRYLLTHEIQEEYILFFQEDMWLQKATDAVFFDNLFELAVSCNWEQVKLHSAPVYRTRSSGEMLEGFVVAELDNEASDYLMSHQVTLWRKDFLLAQLQENEHAWLNEEKASKRLRKLNPVIRQMDYFSENGGAPNNVNLASAKGSLYYTVSSNGMLNSTVVSYIELLQKGSDSEQEYAQLLNYHYLHRITHDGKPKPLQLTIKEKLKQGLLKSVQKMAPGLVKKIVMLKRKLS